MSIIYCDKHDSNVDLDDYPEGCPKCEQEDIERAEAEERFDYHYWRRDSGV